MTAIEIPKIGVRVGDEWTFDDGTGPSNGDLPDGGGFIPDQPRNPPPPAPTELRREREPKLSQEIAPAEIAQQENVPEAETAAEVIAGPRKGKGHVELFEDDSDTFAEDENQWMRYPLPSALSSAPDDLPDTVLEIVRISVENVAARVAEAETRRQEEEEARQRALNEEAERAKEKEKGKEKEIDYLPIIIPDTEAERKLQEEELARRRHAAWSGEAGFSPSSGVNGSANKYRGHKRHKYGVSRILGRLGGGDKGEPSTSGAANNKSGKVSESTAMNVLRDRDTILRQLGVSVPKRTGRKNDESSRATSPPGKPPPDIDPRLSQLRVATALLQRNFEHPHHRLSTVGSVRRRVEEAKKVIRETVADWSGSESENEAQLKKKDADGATVQSKDGRAESQSDADSAEYTECISCFDDFLPETMVKAPCHSYCRDCFTRLIANALQNEQQWPPKCCLNEIPFATIYACIETDLRNTFQARAREWSTPIGERVYCHEPECSVWLSADLIDTARRIATCPRNHRTCTICRGVAHEGSDCPEDRDVNRTNELAEAEGWKRCARCHALVEHGEACQHMTCRCGYEFCYVCTRVWRTCACTMEELMALKARAVARRREREEREAREETELQEALRQIENLELQEALEAIERSLELERKETLRRRREIAGRLEEEERRRAGVAERFISYREVLASLHDRQREALSEDAKKRIAAVQRENAAELARLQESHDTELTDLRAREDSRTKGLERELAAEFTERIAIEREVEEDYRARLNTFWSGMKNDEAEVERAISAFRKSVEARRGEWERWRGEELECAKFVAEENTELRREGLAVKRKRKEKELRGREREERKMGKAGTGWLGAVVEEREVLMREREERETEDSLSFEAYDPVEVAIVREMVEIGEDIEAVNDEDDGSESDIGLPRQTPGSWPLAEAGPSGT